jgi:hypothetical protein
VDEGTLQAKEVMTVVGDAIIRFCWAYFSTPWHAFDPQQAAQDVQR